MERKEVKLDVLKNWHLILNEGYEVSEELKETIKTLEKGCNNTISFVVIGDSSLYPIPLNKEVNYDEFESETIEGMKATLRNPPDMNLTVMHPENSDEIVGGLVQMPDGMVGVISKEKAILKEDGEGIEPACAMMARAMVLDACEKEKIIGFLISNKCDC